MLGFDGAINGHSLFHRSGCFYAVECCTVPLVFDFGFQGDYLSTAA